MDRRGPTCMPLALPLGLVSRCRRGSQQACRSSRRSSVGGAPAWGASSASAPARRRACASRRASASAPARPARCCRAFRPPACPAARRAARPAGCTPAWLCASSVPRCPPACWCHFPPSSRSCWTSARERCACHRARPPHDRQALTYTIDAPCRAGSRAVRVALRLRLGGRIRIDGSRGQRQQRHDLRLP